MLAQLDQYTERVSKSLTGIPLIITAIFVLSNPRIYISESLQLPPCLFGWTPGVYLKTSTNSLFPMRDDISEAHIVLAAIGVFLSTAY